MYIQVQNFGNKSSIKSSYHKGVYECAERIHQFPEIVCVLQGEIEITVDGVVETARAGDIAVITPFKTHSFKTRETCEIWIGVISLDFVVEFFAGENLYVCGNRSVFTPTKSLFAYVTEHLPDKHDVPYLLDADKIKYKSIKALTYPIFEEYTRLVSQEKKHIKNNALAAVLLYMGEHFEENISLVSLSAALGYTPTYVSHCISVIPNMNFRKLLNSLRIDKAKVLLNEGKLRMLDIAIECGFSCERSFNRAFSEILGMTPGEYKKLNY